MGQLTYDGKPLAPGAPVALLRIPALGLREVVAEGTTSEVLMSGPGHRRDTALPGQAGASVIMGRKWGYGSPFNDVHRLPNGARVEVTTGQGKAVYEVTGVRHPGDPNPAALGRGEGRLTLMTATGGAYTPEDVVRIDAELVGPARPSPPRPLRPGWITAAEKPLMRRPRRLARDLPRRPGPAARGPAHRPRPCGAGETARPGSPPSRSSSPSASSSPAS